MEVVVKALDFPESRTKKTLPKHGIFLGGKFDRFSLEQWGSDCDCLVCAIIRHFVLTLELDIELEFDGLLCIVTRAIVYPKNELLALYLSNIFFLFDLILSTLY